MKTQALNIFIFPAVLFCSVACNGLNLKGGYSKQDLIGKWSFNLYYPEGKAEKLLGKSIDRYKMTITLDGKKTFNENETSDLECRIEVHLTNKKTEEEESTDFSSRETSTWKLDGSNLTEVTVDASIVPANNVAKKRIEETPDAAESLRPLNGTTTTSSILTLNSSLMELRDNSANENITFHRIQ